MKIKLKEPLDIDVSAIAKSLNDFVYRPPFEGAFGYNSSELIRDDTSASKQVVLCFDGKTKDGFTEISTDYNEKELSVLIEKIDQPLAKKLNEALIQAKQGGTLFNAWQTGESKLRNETFEAGLITSSSGPRPEKATKSFKIRRMQDFILDE